MNLSQLYYFRTLARLQHYTKAAAELFIAQSTLSNAMANLERELGVPLFARKGRTVELTKYGREFEAAVIESLNALDKGVERAREQAELLTGTIDIGTVYTVQDRYLPALMRAYRASYGDGLTVNLFQGLTLPLLEDLERDRYELAFAAYVENRPGLTFVPVLSQSLVALLHRNHPLASRESLSLAELASHDCPIITYRPETPIGTEVARHLDAAGLKAAAHADDEISLGALVDSENDSVGLVLNTLGLAPFINLVAVPLSDVPKDFHPICLVYKERAFKTRAVETFIEFTTEFKWDPSAEDTEDFEEDDS